MRGIDAASLPALQRRLDALGLLDADAASESVRNIIASPLSDLDPSAIVDTTPIVTALEARLRANSSLHRLPPKFGFLIGMTVANESQMPTWHAGDEFLPARLAEPK